MWQSPGGDFTIIFGYFLKDKDLAMKNFPVIWVLSIVLLMGCLSPGVSRAGEEEDTFLSGLSVTPRLWLSFFNFTDEDDASREVSFMPLYGGTIRFSPALIPGAEDLWPNVDFLLTGFHGTAEADVIFSDTLATVGSVKLLGESDQERTDIEGILRYHFPNGVSIGAGMRYVLITLDDSFSTTFGTYLRRSEVELWLGEIGTSVSTELSEDGLHRGFGNFVLVGGSITGSFRENRSIVPGNPNFNSDFSDFVYGADANVGYQFWFLPNANVSLRYRAFILLAENDFGLVKTTTVHGPEASIGFVF